MSHRTTRSSAARGGAAALATTLTLTLAACGVPPSGVSTGDRAPTGIASGPTLYFLDSGGDLVGRPRDAGRLGSIADALALLLTGTSDPDLRSGIAPVDVTRVGVTDFGDMIELRMPLAEFDVTPRGLDQIACTALAVHIQAGGSPDTTVRVRLTMTEPGSEAEHPRTCPALP